jgi:hypothetical protein
MDKFLQHSIWIDDAVSRPDRHVAFRGRFKLTDETMVKIRSLGASWYEAYCDGEFAFEGPLRYPQMFPEYDETELTLKAGDHVLAVHVHYLGVETRFLTDISPFLCLAICDSNGNSVQIEWKCRELDGFVATGRRINPQLPWIQWEDTEKNPVNWQQLQFCDEGWKGIVTLQPRLGEVQRASIDSVASRLVSPRLMAQGPLAEKYGYEYDDISARFFLRDLECQDVPAQGKWLRYDLGRVRLMRPDFVIDLPTGALVEFAYCEELQHARVSPYINLSAGSSCNLDHFVARGGPQRFRPIHSKGGRFVELHILRAAPESIGLRQEIFIERSYYGEPLGSFECDDDRLNRIWHVGCETFRACSEDALVDTPTRERGQWAGDLVSVGLDIGSVLYSDLRLIRRGLRQCAEFHREDGLIAALAPGQTTYLCSYSAQWSVACIQYWKLTGDREILKEFLGYALRNATVFIQQLNSEGISDAIGAAFIDWGYQRNSGPTDMALNMHALDCLRAMIEWCDELELQPERTQFVTPAEQLEMTIRKWILAQYDGRSFSAEMNYHRLVFALALDLIPAKAISAAIGQLKAHLMGCFPNNPDAPRNADPTLTNSRLISTYFAHFALPVLIEHGEMDFVLDQYRTCWGWALAGGRTTWVEVFDTRWSHCHQWSGCPTWQLSRYVLGLHPRFDAGINHFDFNFHPGSLQRASGEIPIAGTDSSVVVQWELIEGTYEFRIESVEPLTLMVSENYATSPRTNFQFVNSASGEPWYVAAK